MYDTPKYKHYSMFWIVLAKFTLILSWVVRSDAVDLTPGHNMLTLVPKKLQKLNTVIQTTLMIKTHSNLLIKYISLILS